MKTIKVLLLEDMSDDFSAIENIIGEISNELATHQVKLELLYDYDSSLKLISNFVASERMLAQLQPPFKAVVSQMIAEIKAESDLICLLDIVWTVDAKKKIEKTEKHDEYGCDFYCRYLNNGNAQTKKNTLIVSARSKKPNRMSNIELVPKLNNKVPFGDAFKTKLKSAICALPVVNITESSEEKGDT